MSCQSRLVALPNEILGELCKLLSQKDVASLRRTSKAFAAIGFQHLWSEVRFVLEERCMARLEKISKDPAINRAVRSLVYETDTLPWHGHETWVHYTRDLDVEPPGSPICDDCFGDCNYDSITKLQLQEGWASFRKVQAYQDRLCMHTKKRQALLSKILRRFPNISEVSLANEAIGDYVWTLPCCKKYYRCTLVGPSPGDLIDPGIGAVELGDLLIVFGSGQLRLRHLNVSQVALIFFQDLLEGVDRIKNFQGCLENLMHLSMVISLNGYSDPTGYNTLTAAEQAPCQRSLAVFLSKALSLKELILEFKYFDDPEDDSKDSVCSFNPLCFENIISQSTWSHLRVLNLRYFRTSSAAFLALVHNQGHNLKYLKLSDVWLLDGNWADLFDEVEDAMDLDVLELMGEFGYGELDVAHYFERVLVRKNHGIEMWFCGCTVQSVRLISSHKLGQILYGREGEISDGVIRCADWHLRGIGQLPLPEGLVCHPHVRRGSLLIHQEVDA